MADSSTLFPPSRPGGTQVLHGVMDIRLLCTLGRSELEISVSVHCFAVIQTSLASPSPHSAYVKLKPLLKWQLRD